MGLLQRACVLRGRAQGSVVFEMIINALPTGRRSRDIANAVTYSITMGSIVALRRPQLGRRRPLHRLLHAAAYFELTTAQIRDLVSTIVLPAHPFASHHCTYDHRPQQDTGVCETSRFLLEREQWTHHRD